MKLTQKKNQAGKHLISKLIVVLFLFAITPIAKSQAQQVQLTGQGISLRNAFDQIEKQTNFSIDYDAKTIDVNHIVKSIPKPNSLSEVITELLQEVNSTFTITGNHIIITPKTPKNNVQARRISGIVIDKKTNEPLIGANVIVKGTTNGTVTNLDGKFSLDLVGDKTKISINYVGYIKLELEAPKSGILKVELEDNSIEMSEVVVVGYGTVKKSDLTGSIASISSKEMKTTSVLSADQALQGRTSGVVVVNNSGAPGGGVSIKIRGTGSFGNTDPLYVVDGMPVKDDSFGKSDNPTGISFLNPNDIESIQVLKDASAAAIYGTRGANGVILITTKRGKSGVMKVDVDSYVGIQTLPRTMSMLNSQQFATLYNEVNKLTPINPTTIPGLNTTDWIGEITHQALVHNNQVSVSGGKEGNTFFLSLNNYSQDGIVKKSGFNRQSVRFNADNKINNWLKVGQSFSLMQSNRDRLMEGGGGVIESALKADPTVAPYDSVGNWSYLDRLQAKSNPIANVDLTNYNYKNIRFQGSIFLEIELLKNLKYKINGGLDKSWGDRQEFHPIFAYGPDARNDIATFFFEQEKWTNWLLENTLSYTLSKGQNKFDFLVGYTAQAERKEYTNTEVILPDNNPDNRYLSSKTGLNDSGGGASEWGLLSQLGRFNYAYGDKYLLTASVRRDGSSRFGENKKYGVFPSASVAWKISNENFFQNVSFLSDVSTFKLRAGWGQVGNQNIGAYRYNGSVSSKPDQGRPALGVYFGSNKDYNTFFTDKTTANPEVGWETNTSINIGLDGGIWSNKLTFSIDLYNKTSTDVLMEKVMPLYLGQLEQSFGKPMINLGEINNKGIEVMVSYRNTIGDFDYGISGNISKNINKVIALKGGNPPTIGNSTVIKDGLALGTFYGFKTEGIFQDSLAVVNHAFQNSFTAPGDIKFKDINNDGKIDGNDQTYLGNAFPSFNYGLTINLSYKGFDLSIFGQGVTGNLVYNQLKQNVLYKYTIGTNVSPDLLNAWGRTLPDGSKITDTNIPRLMASDKNSNNRFSDYYLEDGSYFRIKSIAFGYNFKGSLLTKMKISNLRLYCTLQNVFTLTKYSGFDPEIGGSTGWNASPLDFGVDSGAYPQPKIYMMGLNLSF